MSKKKHIVDLSEEEQQELETFSSKGTHRAEDIIRAKILLKAEDGLTDFRISEPVGCHWKTVLCRIARRRRLNLIIFAFYRDNGVATPQSTDSTENQYFTKPLVEKSAC